MSILDEVFEREDPTTLHMSFELEDMIERKSLINSLTKFSGVKTEEEKQVIKKKAYDLLNYCKSDIEEVFKLIELHESKEGAEEIIETTRQMMKEEDKDSVKQTFSLLKKKVTNHLLMKERNNATEILTSFFLKTERIYSTRDDLKCEMWIYKEGIYLPQAKTYIKEFVKEMCGMGFTTQLCNEVIVKIEVETYIEAENFFIVQDCKKIAVQNGILDIVSKELSSFSPDMFFFNKLPVSYFPGSKCPKIVKFLSSVLEPDSIRVVQEFFGFLLLKDYKFEKALMCLGEGRNGKGKLVELMKRFLGMANCTSLSLQRIETDEFSKSELFMKLANISADISSSALKSTGEFKTLTGHDMVTANRKFLRPISFTNFAKFVFCANELPRTSDLTLAFFNRWILLKFPYTFLSQSELDKVSEVDRVNCRVADKSIIEAVSTQKELDGLLVWALEGWDRLSGQNDFSYDKGTEEVKRLWLRNSDSFTAFCMDCLEENFQGAIHKNELRKIYILYCRENKIRPVSDKFVRDGLLKLFGCGESRKLVGEERVLIWEGISFKESLFLNNVPNGPFEKSKKGIVGVVDVKSFVSVLVGGVEYLVEDLVRDYGERARFFVEQLLEEGVLLGCRPGVVKLT